MSSESSFCNAVFDNEEDEDGDDGDEKVGNMRERNGIEARRGKREAPSVNEEEEEEEEEKKDSKDDFGGFRNCRKPSLSYS
jgi:hypothetical protein